MVLFEPKSWWKDDLYCLLKISCFELFNDRKYGPFFSQKVDEKMMFTCRFELSKIFQDLGNMAFCAMIRLSYVFWNLSIVKTVQMFHSVPFIFQIMLGDIIIMLDLPVGVSWWRQLCYLPSFQMMVSLLILPTLWSLILTRQCFL